MTNAGLVNENISKYRRSVAALPYTNMQISDAGDEDTWFKNFYPHDWQALTLKGTVTALAVVMNVPAPPISLNNSLETANYRELRISNLRQNTHIADEDLRVTTNPVSASNMIEVVRDYFGLNMAQAARVFNVSRATLYNHIGSSDASVQNYQELYKLAIEMREKGFGSVSGKIKSASIDGVTLLDILYRNPMDSSRIVQACQVLANTRKPKTLTCNVDAIRSSIAGISKG